MQIAIISGGGVVATDDEMRSVLYDAFKEKQEFLKLFSPEVRVSRPFEAATQGLFLNVDSTLAPRICTGLAISTVSTIR